jgi:hypothetical protein
VNQFGLWTHLATVYAPARHLLAHHVNGRAVQSIRIPSTGRVVISSANLGNYTHRLRMWAGTASFEI